MRVPLGLVSLFFAFSIWAQQDEPSFDEETALISNLLDIRSGLTVADVGAGEGYYTLYLAEQVGPGGRVFATEIVPDLVDAIRTSTADRQNVTVILGEEDSTGLPEKCCDRILLRRVFHHMHHPELMLKSLLASLKPGGSLLIIDFLPRHNVGRHDATPQDGVHGTNVPHMIDQVTGSGFELVRQVHEWPSRMEHGQAIDYAVLFRRGNRAGQ